MMLKPLLHFFLIGGLLFGFRIAIWGPARPVPEITVEVPANATDREVEGTIREAILLAEARRNDWDRRDPIVFTHLVRNMRFIEPETKDDDHTLFARAIEMEMNQRDPIVRARLLQRAEAALASAREDDAPSEAALEAHRLAHPDRFQREGKARFEHVFLSRSKRGDRWRADAESVRAALASLDDAESAHRLGDPLPGVRPIQSAALSRISRDYGSSLAKAVREAPLGAWQGPIETVYGLHFIRVITRTPDFVPPLSEIATEVRADLVAEIGRRLSVQRFEALRNAYVIHLERTE